MTSLISLAATDDDGKAAAKAIEEDKPVVKPTLPEERFKNALIKIAAKEYTVAELKENYTLTKDQEARL